MSGHVGRAYLVLGATGGIGSDLCRRLAGAGAKLMVAGRDEAKARVLAQELGAESRTFEARDLSSIDAVARGAHEAFGRLDGVAHCVGSLLLKPALATSDAEFDDTYALNLRSAFGALRAAVREMEMGGSVVLVSSVAARFGLANHEAIAAAKAGVIGLTLSAAATYAPKNVRVNAVAPGLVETPLTTSLTQSAPMRKASEAMHPLGRIGTPSDVASAMAWLLSGDSSWVTGQVLGVDGGLGSARPRR
ncbi:MAG TPA: SDR family oxidoreductase [Myxococcaceae bacterium]|nr:SDR family oxidoreductase [Myxococcaceae bacterium]